MIARCPLRAVLSSHLPSIISIMDACCWLVVVFVMTKWRPSKAKVSHLFNLFLPFESLPELMQRWYPARSTPAAPPLQHPTCRGRQLSVDLCVLLFIGGHLRPTPLPWLYFWCVEFIDPNKGTSSGESNPDNARMCVCVLGFRFQGVVVITRFQSLLLPPGKVLPICVTQ
jgi:hypothetical protein